MIIFIPFIVFIIFLIFYLISSSEKIKKTFKILTKLALTICILETNIIVLFIFIIIHLPFDADFLAYPIFIFITSFILPLWIKKIRRILLIIITIYLNIILLVILINCIQVIIDNNVQKINYDVSINTEEYLPFSGDSKIAKLNHKASLKLNSDLPVLDGAAAVFPVYSAFINAVYPKNVEYGEEPFLYTNTKGGYKSLAEKKIDIFFGAYPSQEQINYAEKNDTEFEYTEIGKEGFVFFVNKSNPIESLTTQQIKDIYSGKIINWKKLGGKNQKILAFQRNKGSGSQSMLIRFMNKTPLMEPPKDGRNDDNVIDSMGGIIQEVADYKNYNGSIGFSFRYYFNTIVNAPNVKMISVDGVEPTKENITNGTYPIITPLYAVTYKDNPNENVKRLIDWILSDEGQELIEETGYARIK